MISRKNVTAHRTPRKCCYQQVFGELLAFLDGEICFPLASRASVQLFFMAIIEFPFLAPRRERAFPSHFGHREESNSDLKRSGEPR
jgi:hypothetical protein